MAGSKPGERRGGRKRGVPNKSTAEIKAIAQKWGPDAIKALAGLAGLDPTATKAESEQARIAALGMIMDRAYGKPSQTIAGDAENPLKLVGKIEVVVVDPSDIKG